MKLSKAIILLSFTLFGCMGLPVDQGDRDHSGAYTGTWNGVIAGTEEVQRSSQYTYYCSPVSAEVDLEIDDGVVVGRVRAKETVKFRTYINSEGYFQGQMPIGHVMPGGDVGITPMNILVLIEGMLAEDGVNGVLTIAIPKDGYNGCRTDIRFSRAGD